MSSKQTLPCTDEMVSIYCGDSANILRRIESNTIDLIVTSPPYADQRKKMYGGVHPDRYVEWFLPITEELLRVLKPGGTFILNIKEKVLDGERHTYVLELILALRRQGWLWTEEYIWHKKNSYPGKWPNRFRDAWERLLQFNKQKKFKMYQDAVKIPIGGWADKRLKNLSNTDMIRDNSKVGSGFGKNISNWVNKKFVLPDNVLYLSTECSNKNHCAVFPSTLPRWFINLFTVNGDKVLDPFMGSGTTVKEAYLNGRYGIGIDISQSYCDSVNKWYEMKIQDRKLLKWTK